MPIRPENRDRYPPPREWKAIRAAILERAGDCCEFCGKPHLQYVVAGPEGQWLDEYGGADAWIDERGRPCPPPPAGVRRSVRVILTIAHLDHTPENNADDNLRALCQRCHNRHDAPHRAETRARTRAAEAREAGLLDLPLDGGGVKGGDDA